MEYTASTNRIWMPHAQQFWHFVHRDRMRPGHPTSNRPTGILEAFSAALPAAPLPVDWTKNDGLVFAYDGNDRYGDCMYAAACHGDNTFTGNVGTESVFDVDMIVRDYLILSGGDNGLNEGLVLGAWKQGLAGVPQATIFDAVDVDPTNANLMQAAIYLFGGVQFTFSVPSRWINNFSTNCVWDGPAVPNRAMGHGIFFNGVDALGRYKLQTWGTHAWITPRGVADCEPAAFAVASLRWFNPLGYAPNGLHYNELAALWVRLGGNPWPPSPFPAPAPPPPLTPPTPTPGPAPEPTPGPLPPVTIQMGVYELTISAIPALRR